MRRSSAVRPLLAAAVFLALLAVPASAAAPAPTALPAISGTARAGQILSSTTGTFSGTAPLTYGRTWQRCDDTGASCAAIIGASAATYTLAAADVGKTIRVTVLATNLEGSASATSAPTAIVAPLAPPLNGGLPAVTGTARDGQVLTATDGAWTGTAPITFTRLWQRCDAGGAACAPITGASAATRTLTSADVGATMRIEVTAHNADGQGVASSLQTAVVAPAAPVNAVAPAITGSARSGQTLSSATPGTWTGTTPMTYARQWSRCDAGGGACAPIADAVGSTYVLTDDDVGATIRVAVTATNVASSATASSAASATVGPRVPPVEATDPAITGTTVDGLVLTATDGTWSGTPTITTTRQWQRCSALGLDCADIAATATTITLTSADVGSTFRTRVTATNPDGATQAYSATTAAIAPALPSVTAAPAVAGTAREGQLLTATTGTWKGTPQIAFDYAWQRCTSGACATIAGATAASYRLVAADVGTAVRVLVSATNAAGSSSAPSARTTAVAGGVPVSLTPPDVSGALPRDGDLYSSTLGSWGGTAPLVYDRQWLRCNATGASCTPLSGEIGASYRLASADVGKTIRVEVTATNALGATKAQSAASPVILAAPPQADAPPQLQGALRDGQTLTATSSWSGTAPIALSWQWQRCDALAPTCADIAGATAATYQLGSADVGSRMRIRVGALNAGGGGVATSDLAIAGDPAGLVAPSAPQATGAPVITGAAVEGSTLSTSNGTFTGTVPMTFAVRWQRCDGAGAACADIPGATAFTYVAVAADRGATLRTIVTAVNGSGSDSGTSAASAVVALAPPRNVVAPSVAPDTGLRDGATLTSTDGGWAGSAPITLAYRWQRCHLVTDCADVAGAAGPTYMLSTSDTGFSLRLVVTASNGAGSTSQASALTGIVGTNPPVSVLPPTVTGTARDGAVLTAVDGVWAGPVVYTTSYEWWRCDALGANCSLLPGATAASLVLGPAEIGLTLRARVQRTSAGGATAVFSAPTAPVVAAPPVNVALPVAGGGAALGRTLTADPGTWSGTAPLDFAYQWRRCGADGNGCADIAGATAATYTATAADGGARLRVVIAATNAVGAGSATSAATLVVETEPPSVLSPPQVSPPASGPVAVGATVTAAPGTWGGAQPITFAYQWARCDAAGAACVPVAGATASAYALVKADIGKRMVVTVTATNVVADATAVSGPSATVLPEPPAVVTPPAVTAPSGLRAGAKLTASTGSWTGATPLTYAISWLRCEADGSGCVAIAGAAGTSYALTADDVGKRIRARVAASNVTAEVTADSAPTVAIAAAPVAPPPPPPPAPPAPPTTATTPKPATSMGTGTGATPGGTSSTTPATTSSPATATKTKGSARNPIAAVQRLRLTPGGVLILTLRCPLSRPRACAASGTIVAGTSLGEVIPGTKLRFTIRALTVPKGRARTRTYKLTAAQREALASLKTVDFRVRLAAPKAPRRIDEVFVHTVVPSALRTRA